MQKFRKGLIVEVEFLDHVEDGSEPISFTVYGRVRQVHRKYVVIEGWAYTDHKIPCDSNVKFWTLLRSTIVNWWKLEKTENPKIGRPRTCDSAAPQEVS